MIIAIPDDYHGVVSTLDCFRLLAGHDVRIYREAAAPFEVMPLLGLENALARHIAPGSRNRRTSFISAKHSKTPPHGRRDGTSSWSTPVC
jgi:hypothetical protein